MTRTILLMLFFGLLVNLPTAFSQVTTNPYLKEKDLKARAEKKAKEFFDYVVVISSKNSSTAHRRLAKEAASNCFEDANQNPVQVTSLRNPKPKSLPAAVYLTRLEVLFEKFNYDEVEFSYEIGFVGNVEKGKDGKYYVPIDVHQYFRGSRDGKVIYGDKTIKRLEIKIEVVKEDQWIVWLTSVDAEAVYKLSQEAMKGEQLPGSSGQR